MCQYGICGGIVRQSLDFMICWYSLTWIERCGEFWDGLRVVSVGASHVLEWKQPRQPGEFGWLPKISIQKIEKWLVIAVYFTISFGKTVIKWAEFVAFLVAHSWAIAGWFLQFGDGPGHVITKSCRSSRIDDWYWMRLGRVDPCCTAAGRWRWQITWEFPLPGCGYCMATHQALERSAQEQFRSKVGVWCFGWRPRWASQRISSGLGPICALANAAERQRNASNSIKNWSALPCCQFIMSVSRPQHLLAIHFKPLYKSFLSQKMYPTFHFGRLWQASRFGRSRGLSALEFERCFKLRFLRRLMACSVSHWIPAGVTKHGWLENPLFTDDFPSYKLPLIGDFPLPCLITSG